MEAVRNKQLDNICEGIGDDRETANAARKDEAQKRVNALRIMQREGIMLYTHARIELARNGGEESLSVRAVKGEGDSAILEGGKQVGSTQPAPEPEAEPPGDDLGDDLGDDDGADADTEAGN